MRLGERDSTYVEVRTLILEFEKPVEDQEERKQGLWIDPQPFLWSPDSEKKTILSSNPVSPHQTTKEMCVQNPSPSWGTPQPDFSTMWRTQVWSPRCRTVRDASIPHHHHCPKVRKGEKAKVFQLTLALNHHSPAASETPVIRRRKSNSSHCSIYCEQSFYSLLQPPRDFLTQSFLWFDYAGEWTKMV